MFKQSNIGQTLDQHTACFTGKGTIWGIKPSIYELNNKDNLIYCSPGNLDESVDHDEMPLKYMLFYKIWIITESTVAF